VDRGLKHAPGAPIEIVVDCAQDSLSIEVVNATASSAAGPPLGHSGGGHGLTGMRERVIALGGSFHAGRRDDGAWQVSVRLPVSGKDPDGA
jgi:signal transduction histidine kinase